MPHPNSLMFNVYVIPFWPMKMYWFTRKVSCVKVNDTDYQNHFGAGLPNST